MGLVFSLFHFVERDASRRPRRGLFRDYLFGKSAKSNVDDVLEVWAQDELKHCDKEYEPTVRLGYVFEPRPVTDAIEIVQKKNHSDNIELLRNVCRRQTNVFKEVLQKYNL